LEEKLPNRGPIQILKKNSNNVAKQQPMHFNNITSKKSYAQTVHNNGWSTSQNEKAQEVSANSNTNISRWNNQRKKTENRWINKTNSESDEISALKAEISQLRETINQMSSFMNRFIPFIQQNNLLSQNPFQSQMFNNTEFIPSQITTTSQESSQ